MQNAQHKIQWQQQLKKKKIKKAFMTLMAFFFILADL